MRHYRIRRGVVNQQVDILIVLPTQERPLCIFHLKDLPLLLQRNRISANWNRWWKMMRFLLRSSPRRILWIPFPSLLHSLWFSPPPQTMEFQTLITAFIALVMLFERNVTASKDPLNTPALCEPGVVDEMPPHIKKVCLALENSNQLSSALNAYIRNEAAGELSVMNSHFPVLNRFQHVSQL